MAANAAGTNIVMFSQDANKQKAAWEYLKFLTSADATTEWAMTTGYLPVRTSAYESETYQQFMATDPTSVAAYSQSAYFISQPAFEGSYDVMKAISNTLEEQILNEADAQTTLDALVKAVNDILQK
jgi:multiple sugar transport system substrate-binding protein